MLLLSLWFVRMKFPSWQVACKRAWNHLLLVPSPLRAQSENSILQSRLTIYSQKSPNYLQSMDISQSEPSFPAVKLKHMKKGGANVLGIHCKINYNADMSPFPGSLHKVSGHSKFHVRADYFFNHWLTGCLICVAILTGNWILWLRNRHNKRFGK